MKRFSVVVDRTKKSTITIEVEAESAREASETAVMLAHSNPEAFGEDKVEFHAHDVEEVVNPYIDQFGNPYECEGNSWPAGGGLHKDCDYNAEALYCFYTLKNREAITAFLTKRGFTPGCQDKDYEEWYKGNTKIIFECYDPKNQGGLWGYVCTELA